MNIFILFIFSYSFCPNKSSCSSLRWSWSSCEQDRHSNSGGSECLYERHDANSISTQATIILQQDHCSLTDVHGLEPPTSFTIQQLRSDEEYKSWTGVSQGFFMVLRDLIKEPHQSNTQVEKCLLILLIKLKTNLTYCALASMFCLHRQTISRITKTKIFSNFELLDHWSYPSYWQNNCCDCIHLQQYAGANKTTWLNSLPSIPADKIGLDFWWNVAKDAIKYFIFSQK